MAPPLVTVSSRHDGNQGPAALEAVFHEASHVLVGGLMRQLEDAFRARGEDAPATLWHALLFFTTGEVLRRQLPEGYVPYAYARSLYARDPTWAKATREAAVEALVESCLLRHVVVLN